MANTPKKQATYSFLESVNKLDELHSRLSFIEDAITQSTDWIEDSAAQGLFFTIQSIKDDVEVVSESIHINLKSIPCGIAA